MKTISKLLSVGALALGFLTHASADALSAKPLRIGPVQNYGALGTNGNKVVSISSGDQVMLRGMSLYWSDALGIQYYNKEVVKWAANTLGADVIRFAMGIEYYDNGSNKMDENYSYKGSPASYKSKLDQMIEAAIENDIYIIVDWHSHRAHQETDLAKAFFSEISKKYANIPNVIYEIFNEPIINDWGTIKTYANTVTSEIRKNTKNLILVGTGNYSQNPGNAAKDPLSQANIAYVLHFYAASHSQGSFKSTIETAFNANQAVFISEWGTTNYDGDGEPSASATSDWTSYMEEKKISNCNWSLRHYTSTIDNKSEKSAFFTGDKTLSNQQALESAERTTSGAIVEKYINGHKTNWADVFAKKATGSCSFTSQSVLETQASIASVLKSGCTYTSSDESVASINGTSIDIHSAGFAIFTGNDGSKSVVSVQQIPHQTINGFEDYTCSYQNECSKNHKLGDLSGQGKSETLLTIAEVTAQGGTFSLKALNPEIADIKQATCTSSDCYSSKGKKVYLCELKQFGEAKFVATAPAVSGYRAMNDTITISYTKATPKIHSKFKSQTIALGTTVENALPDTTLKNQIPVTYTFNGTESSPYLTKSGSSLIAGNQNAIVYVTAHTPESEYFLPLEKSVVIIIGDSTQAVNKDEFYTAPIIAKSKTAPLQAKFTNSELQLHLPKTGLVHWGIYSLQGRRIAEKTAIYTAGAHNITLDVPAGMYIFRLKQGTEKQQLKFLKK